MKIALGCDHAGFKLKEFIKDHLIQEEFYVYDFGTFDETSIDYPDIAYLVGDNVSRGFFDRGIFICGSGVGGSIVLNKVGGVRAALCREPYTARLSREHNDANVLALGGRITGAGLALEIVEVFLATNFQAGRHQTRLEKVNLYEKQYQAKNKEK